MCYSRIRAVGCVLGVAAGLLCFSPASRGSIAAIELDPAHPREGDRITITTHVEIKSTCWAIRDSMACSILSDSTLAFDYFLVYADSADVCHPVLATFSVPCDFGALPAGRYRFTATEHHESATYPEPDVEFLDLWVTPGPAPTRVTTWGMIKSRYR
jgi:hypothetical protein